MSGELTRFLLQIGAETQFGKAAHVQCGAKCKRSGLPCVQPAMKNGRCRLHGGKTPKGTERDAFPKCKRDWQRRLKDLARHERRAQRYESKQTAPAYDWYAEQELLKTGLLQRAGGEHERNELRKAFYSYSAGHLPWQTWRQTLEHLGLA
jgi:hypothetical protein